MAARAAADADADSFDALDMVSGGGRAEGRVSKARTGIFAWTLATGDQRTQAHLLQWSHGENILRPRAVIQSVTATIRGGRNHHGRVLLTRSLLVTLLGQGDEGGAMRSPMGPLDLEFFCLTASNKKYVKDANYVRV